MTTVTPPGVSAGSGADDIREQLPPDREPDGLDDVPPEPGDFDDVPPEPDGFDDVPPEPGDCDESPEPAEHAEGHADGLIAPSTTHPQDLLPDDDFLSLQAYLMQTPQAPLPTVDATDKLVAGALAALLNGRLRYTEKSWFAWAGTMWEEISTAEVSTMVRALLGRADHDATLSRRILPVKWETVTPDMIAELVAAGLGVEHKPTELGASILVDPATRRELKTVAKPDNRWAEMARNTAGIVTDISGRPSVVLKEGFDVNPYEIHCNGWIFDLTRNMAAIPPRRATRRDLVRLSMNADFDPSAPSPTWRTFVGEVCGGDQEQVRFLQKASGASLIGEIREQHGYVIYGELGNNGKSQFAETLLYVFGSYGVEIASSLIQERMHEPHATERMPLRGARFAMTSETNTRARWDSNAFKRLVTPGRMSARGIAENTVHWNASHTLWVTTNNRPRVGAGEAAFFKRYCEIPFPKRWYYPNDAASLKRVSVGPVDNDLPARLRAEAAGIFNWLLEGLMMYWAEGLEAPASILEANRAARGESSLWMEFLNEAAFETGDDASRIDLTPLWNGWNAYRSEGSMRRSDPPSTSTQLQKFVRAEFPSAQYHPAPANGRTKAHFTGIELTDRGKAICGLTTTRTPTPATVTPIFGGNGVGA